MKTTLLKKENIFAHRGIWSSRHDQNSLEAIKAAFSAGYSVETDIVGHNGFAFISHDSSALEACPRVSPEVFGGCIALNLKSDDSWVPLQRMESEIISTESFFFDGSTPTMRQISQTNLNFANRVSEIEREPLLAASHLWVDSFTGEAWWTSAQIEDWLGKYSKIVIVSPELHDLPYEELWRNLIKLIMQGGHDRIGICTDFPSEFERKFAEMIISA